MAAGRGGKDCRGDWAMDAVGLVKDEMVAPGGEGEICGRQGEARQGGVYYYALLCSGLRPQAWLVGMRDT